MSDAGVFYNDTLFEPDHRPHSAKLIDVDAKKGQLKVTEPGQNVLTAIDETKNLNLMFIFGNARSGKSFMMNCMVGVSGMFKVINSSEPCTRGVDLSSYVAPYESLAKQAKNLDRETGATGSGEIKTDAKDPLIGFVDVEGQGAEDETYDTLLAVPLLLTSKIVLFNHKGAPTVTAMLSRLGVLARAAEYVDLSDPNDPKDNEEDADDAGKTKEADGGDDEEPSEQKTKKKGSRKKKFGHLHVLFRDFAFSGDHESVYEQLMGMEKVKAAPKKLGAGGGGHDPAKAAKERNDIRQMLLDNFQSINVWLFKQPASPDELMAHPELPGNLVDVSFLKEARSLLRTVITQMKTPTMFNGSPLTGPRLSTLLGRITTALNSGANINVPSVYRAMETDTVERTVRICINVLEQSVKKMKSALPVSVEDLTIALGEVEKDVWRVWDQALRFCLLEEEKKRNRDIVASNVQKSNESLLRENSEKTLAKVRQVITTECAGARAELEAFCQHNFPVSDPQLIHSTYRLIEGKVKASIENNLDSLPEGLQMPEAKEELEEQLAALKSFRDLKLAQNDAALKDNAINQLREDSNRMQKALEDNQRRLEQHIKEAKEREDRLKQQSEELEAKLGRLRDEQETLVAQSAEDQERLRREKADEIAKVEEHLRSVKSRLQAKAEQLEKNVNELASEKDAKDKEAAELRALAGNVTQERHQRDLTIAEMQKELAKLRDEKEHATGVLHQLAAGFQGFLLKQGQTGLKLFKRRFCIVKNGELRYFKNQGDSKVQGVVALAGCSVQEPVTAIKSKRPFAFVVWSPTLNRQYILVAENDQEKAEWIEHIKFQAANDTPLKASALSVPSGGRRSPATSAPSSRRNSEEKKRQSPAPSPH